VASHTVIDRRPGLVPEARRRELGRRLEMEVAGEVRFGDGDRALYATDASNYRQVPLGVVLPRSAEDAETVVRVCREFEAPVMPRGGGTSLAGQTCNTAVVIDFSKFMHEVVRVDPEAQVAEVEPGCVLDHLQAAARRHGLVFGPDPATHSRNSLGGMIGNDSCGGHSLIAGRTADNVEWLDVLTYDGLRMRLGPTSEAQYQAILAEGGRRSDIYRGMRALWGRHGAEFEKTYPKIPRRISGYENLDQLDWSKGFNVARALVGTEAGCVMVLKAGLKLIPDPQNRVLAMLGFEDVCQAADVVCAVLEHGPIGIEAFDHLLVDYLRRQGRDEAELKLLPKGGGWLMVEFAGDSVEQAAGKARKLVEAMKGRDCEGKVVTDVQAQGGSGRCARTPWRRRPTCRGSARPIRAGRTARCAARISAATCAS
jgi:FAD/FMN-containing dehydrogenase